MFRKEIVFNRNTEQFQQVLLLSQEALKAELVAPFDMYIASISKG